MIERDSWTVAYSFKDDGHRHDVSVLAWSPNGAYLTSASVTGEILVWETLVRQFERVCLRE